MKVAILGGGISGLASAYFLQKLKPDVEIVVLEKQARTGGWVHTCHEGGFLFEAGPRALSRNKAPLWLEMIHDLHMQEKIVDSDPGSSKRFVYWKDVLEQVPDSFLKILISPLTRNSLWAFFKEWSVKPETQKEETLREFFSRRIDAEFADKLIDPLARGIYSGSIDELSVEACFPILKKWELEKGSLTRGFFSKAKRSGPRGYFSVREGLSSVCARLQQQLQTQVMLDTEVMSCTRDKGRWTINTNKGNILADAVISALPAFVLSRVIKTENPAAAILLSEIPYRSLYVVHIGFNEKIRSPKGFGYLVPSKANEKVLGVVFDSNIFPEQDVDQQTRFTVMVSEEVKNLQEAETVALEALKRHVHISQDPVYSAAYFMEKAIPQYVLGHKKRIAAIQSLLSKEEGFFLTGNYLDGLSLEDLLQRAKSLF